MSPRRADLTPEQREKLRKQDRERQRQRRKENPEKAKEIGHNAYQRAKERNGGVNPWLSASRKWRHGGDHEEMWVAFWDAQDGKCYLCGEPLDTESHYGVQVEALAKLSQGRQIRWLILKFDRTFHNALVVVFSHGQVRGACW